MRLRKEGLTQTYRHWRGFLSIGDSGDNSSKLASTRGAMGDGPAAIQPKGTCQE